MQILLMELALYKMEKGAMRKLNSIGNIFFSILFL